ncbi:hypothetical protein [Sphingomonas sp.]|nr:hypothetical protein [Sphingomonas sp.]
MASQPPIPEGPVPTPVDDPIPSPADPVPSAPSDPVVTPGRGEPSFAEGT